MKKLLLVLIALIISSLVLAENHGEAEDHEHEAEMVGTIVDVAMGSEDFSVLVEAVVAAELVETLEGEGPFTVFAPVNQAFIDALEALELSKEELLASEGLAGILTYHVVAGKLMAADVLAAVEAAEGGVAMVETVNGASVAVSLVDGSVMLNDSATVTTVDIATSNGVIHVIDAVILPPTE